MKVLMYTGSRWGWLSVCAWK